MARLENNSLFLDNDETVVFPVEAGHPLASIQQLSQVNNVDDVASFEFVKDWRERSTADIRARQFFRSGRVSEAVLLEEIRQRGDLLVLNLADFVVAAGTTVEPQSPLNKIVANQVIIQGTLRHQGDLVIECNEIRGI